MWFSYALDLLGLLPFVLVLTKRSSVEVVASLLVCLVLSVISVLFHDSHVHVSLVLFHSFAVCCTARRIRVHDSDPMRGYDCD